MVKSHQIINLVKNRLLFIAKRISDWQIIVQQMWRYSKILFVCIYMSTKISILSIVGLKLNCIVPCAKS